MTPSLPQTLAGFLGQNGWKGHLVPDALSGGLTIPAFVANNAGWKKMPGSPSPSELMAQLKVAMGTCPLETADSVPFPLARFLQRNPHPKAAVIARALLKGGVSPNAPDEGGLTPLMACVFSGIDLFDALVRHGLDVNHVDTDGDNALAWTKLVRDEAIAQRWVARFPEAGVDPDHPNRWGEAPRAHVLSMCRDLLAAYDARQMAHRLPEANPAPSSGRRQRL